MARTVGIIGLSHLGLITGIGLASKGFVVTGYDPDPQLIEKLNRDELPVFEKDLDALLRDSRERVSFASSPEALSGCDVLYIARDVPTSDRNLSEVAPVLELFRTILPSVKDGATIVIHSQVSPGFTRSLLPLVASEGRGLKLYYQVETLVFGIAVSRMLQPERYIVGCESPSSPLPPAYAAVLAAFDCPVLPMRYESAELAKISINMFLVSSVITASTLAELCEQIGADWSEIAPTLRLDKRIGPHAYLAPGLGLSGGNLERDLVSVQTMAREHGTDSSVVEAWFTHGEYRRDWVLRTLSRDVLSKNPKAKIGVWGIAYKQDTHSIKNSPSVALLRALNGVSVRAYDPKAKLPEPGTTAIVSSALEAATGADVLVVMTPWREFQEIPPSAVSKVMSGKLILDPFRALDEAKYRASDFSIVTLGRGNETSKQE